ncbi:hypothetical protein [Nannocystis sp.]|uniref:hypothetical protein n=1 Tax=Nannocystis sp. TaxID=1962667 RepID=UPI002423DC1D|nr:hypothetical protein [Nannocystis sp.]MBK7828571.1 hypothetical protein [Nannocystis sp.]MBK9754569.1 hypothetical protein [Nannocystis sp.]
MSTRHPPGLGLPGALVSLILGAILGVACGPPPGASCRLNPLCGSGDIGATCNGNGDCISNHCCGNKDCDGGTCTYQCGDGKKDASCPGGMNCHGGECFFGCAFDTDCANGQRCKDGKFCSWD